MTRRPASALCRRSVLGATFVVGIGCAARLHGDISGQTVVSGNAVFIQTANGWVIKPSDNAIIQYSMFGVNANELIEFIQSDSTSRVLNRVVGDFPTNIDGRLQSNGIVYIVNPAGVFIGPQGLVDVGGIYAAAGNIGDADFLNGVHSFTNLTGRVENAGVVNAKSVAAFMGANVVNSGTIDTGAQGLTALVASTGTVRLVPTSVDSKVFVDIEIISDPLSQPGSPVGVLNSGAVRAGAGGQVALGAGDVYSLAIQNTSTSTTSAAGGIVIMKGQRISQEGQLSGARLNVDCVGMDLASDLRFDRTRINGDVTLQKDVIVRGENGQQAEWFTVRGALKSAANALYDFVCFAGQTIINNDVGDAGAGRLGSLSLHGDAAFGDDVYTRGDLVIDGRTSIYDGNRDQRIESSEGLVRLGDDFIKLGENLTIQGRSVEFGGDGLSVKNLTVRCADGQSITFTGGGDQRIVSHTGISFEGDVVKPAGGLLHLSAPQIATTGDVVNNGGDLVFAGNVDFNGEGDQVAFAQGDLHFLFGAAKSTAGRLDVGGDTIFVHQGVSTANGDLTFNGVTEFVGVGAQTASAGGPSELRFTDDVTKATDGALLVIGESIRLGGDARTTNGSLTLDGNTTLDGEGDQVVEAVGGELVAGGDIEKTTAGDLRLASDDRITLGGDAESQAGSLHIDAPEIVLSSDANQQLLAQGDLSFNAPISKAVGDLQIVSEGGEGRIEVGGDVIVESGRLTFRGPVLLQLDATMEGDRVTFDGTIDGAFALVVNADERINFLGDIGMNTPGGKGGAGGLRSLTLRAGEFVEFGNEEGTSIRVAEGISFNGDDAATGPIPKYATIGSAGDLTIECGEFLMGARQKLTVLGTLEIDAGAGTVTFGDVNVLNDLIVNADAIRLRGREAGSVATLAGDVGDLGAEIIAGGTISFSSIPIILGDGSVQFASFDASADLTGNLSGFALQLLGEPLDAASLRQGGVYFDLALSPLPAPTPDAVSTASPATILAVEESVDDVIDADRTILRENERIALNRLLGPGLRLRGQSPVELESGGAGTVAFDAGSTASTSTEVATPRLSRDAAVRFLGAHARLALLAANPEAKARATEIASRVTSASAADRATIVGELERGGDATDAALASAIVDALRWGEAIGLSNTERAAAGANGVAFPESAIQAAIGG